MVWQLTWLASAFVVCYVEEKHQWKEATERQQREGSENVILISFRGAKTSGPAVGHCSCTLPESSGTYFSSLSHTHHHPLHLNASEALVFFFCIPSCTSGVHHFGWDFCVCGRFFNPFLEVVTFGLCGWCMLRVFVASIHPSRTWMSGSFQSVQWSACVHRLVLGDWSQNPCELQGKNSLYQKLRSRSNPQRCMTQDSEPNTLPTELFWPQKHLWKLKHTATAGNLYEFAYLNHAKTEFC